LASPTAWHRHVDIPPHSERIEEPLRGEHALEAEEGLLLSAEGQCRVTVLATTYRLLFIPAVTAAGGGSGEPLDVAGSERSRDSSERLGGEVGDVLRESQRSRAGTLDSAAGTLDSAAGTLDSAAGTLDSAAGTRQPGEGSEDEEEDEEMVVVQRTVASPEAGGELQQLPLGMILQLEVTTSITDPLPAAPSLAQPSPAVCLCIASQVHSGREHPQWPGGRLVLGSKDCRSVQIVFSTHSGLKNVQRHIQRLSFDSGAGGTFSLAYGAGPISEPNPKWSIFSNIWSAGPISEPSHKHCDYVRREAARQQVDAEEWTLDHESNRDWQLCGSYPEFVVLPVFRPQLAEHDPHMAAVAGYRTQERFPALSWKRPGKGPVLMRSSQPRVGYKSAECPQDIASLRLVASFWQGRLVVIDARGEIAGVLNRVRGGGFEDVDAYSGEGFELSLEHMAIDNIHEVRSSFFKLYKCCSEKAHKRSWSHHVAKSRWLEHLCSIIKAAVRVAAILDTTHGGGSSVLVHCSDGWDRTPQLVALAQILLDPYYRTMEGFEALVEKDWLGFGHCFADRGCQGRGSDAFSPVFLQWVDCVHQCIYQFPRAFEYTEEYLVAMMDAVYSCRFGTFCFNSDRERKGSRLQEVTESFWAWAEGEARARDFLNESYRPDPSVLQPNFTTSLRVWTKYYLRFSRVGDRDPAEEERERLLLRNTELESLCVVCQLVEEVVSGVQLALLEKRYQAEIAAGVATEETRKKEWYKIRVEHEDKSSALQTEAQQAKDRIAVLESENFALRARVEQLGRQPSPSSATPPSPAPPPAESAVLSARQEPPAATAASSPSLPGSASPSLSPRSSLGLMRSSSGNWVPDDAAQACQICKKSFSMFKRKHHCRDCGGVVCGDCSRGQLLLEGKMQRACDRCKAASGRQ